MGRLLERGQGRILVQCSLDPIRPAMLCETDLRWRGQASKGVGPLDCLPISRAEGPDSGSNSGKAAPGSGLIGRS